MCRCDYLRACAHTSLKDVREGTASLDAAWITPIELEAQAATFIPDE